MMLQNFHKPDGQLQRVFTCIIVDDDEIDRLTVLSFCKRYSFIQVAGVYDSGKSALQAALHKPPDVLLLDIDMEDISGLDLREQLLSVPACVFITAYPDYAVESFDKAALDFLVKPVTADRFAKTMDRLEQYLNIRQKATLLDHTLGGDVVYIKEGHEQIKILLQEIIYLEALRDYTSIVTTSKKYCVLSSLSGLLEQKPFARFLRIHRSYAVQKNYINRVTPKEVFVNHIGLPIGRTYKELLENIKL